MSEEQAAPAPPPHFAEHELTVREIPAPLLVRISRRPASEPYFGRTGANRFDDPLRVYGVCYAAFDFQVAIAETVLHDSLALPSGGYEVAYSQLSERYLIRFRPGILRLARLHGSPLKAAGGDGRIAKIMPYGVPQLWSRAVFEHPAEVDGFVFMSRHLDDRRGVALFERAREKLARASATNLLDEESSLAFAIQELSITVVGGE